MAPFGSSRAIQAVAFGLPLMKMRGRIVLCGQVANYDSATPPPGLVRTELLIAKRLRMEGTVVYDYAQQFDGAREEIAAHILAGDLIHREEFIEGFKNLPERGAPLHIR